MRSGPGKRRNIVTAGPALWSDILRAVAELAMANRRLGKTAARDLPLAPGGDGGAPGSGGQAALSPGQRRLVERVTYVVPRVGRRVPWRSDCLIQALAARRWLTAHGVVTSLHIGARKSDARGFEAHAWLTVGDSGEDLVVTGWDIEDFIQFASFPAPVIGESRGD